MYDAVFSLGSNCEPAHQLRRNKLWINRGPFDWMITPLDALIAVIEDRGSKLGETFSTTYDGRYAASAEYGCVYFHEFNKDTHGNLLFDSNSINACKSKMTHKWRTMERLCSTRNRILFIRFRSFTDEPHDRFKTGPTLQASEINHLCSVIAEVFPSIDFRLLLVLGDHNERERLSLDTKLDDRVQLESISVEQGPSGNGSDEDWDKILRSAGLRTLKG